MRRAGAAGGGPAPFRRSRFEAGSRVGAVWELPAGLVTLGSSYMLGDVAAVAFTIPVVHQFEISAVP